jgi:2-dehydro-3-deoxygluconokinase
MIVIKEKGTVLTFGEMLIRISLKSNGEWMQRSRFPFYIGGAELNVAAALALWGIPSKYITAVPDNFMAADLLCHLASKNIDVSAIHKCGKRLGLFYLSEGEDMKHDALIYDREGTAFAELRTGMIDWDKVFDGVRWFHFSAICPALSKHTSDVCEEALTIARSKGIAISIDLNYREKLWQYGVPPVQVMPRLVQYCDVVMGNIWAAEKMLGLTVNNDLKDGGSKADYLDAALFTSEKIAKAYPNCRVVANTFRFLDNNIIKYYTTLYTQGAFYSSTTYTSAGVLNKVGSGDCFMAGLIYGVCSNLNASNTLKFATTAAFAKLFTSGDATDMTAEQIIKIITHEN